MSLDVATLDGQGICSLRTGYKDEAAGPQQRFFSNPVMLGKLPMGKDRVLLTLREPATGQEGRLEIPLVEGHGVFQAKLAEAPRSK